MAKIKKQKSNIFSGGFSLIEMIVVVAIMGVIAVIASGLLLTSLMASSKSEVTKEVRQNGNYALSTMEGMILNSLSVSCTGSSGDRIEIRDLNKNLSTVYLDSTILTSKRIASSSGSRIFYLTGENVSVTSLSFDCGVSSPGLPSKVSINFSLSKGLGGRPSERATLLFSTEVMNKNVQ